MISSSSNQQIKKIIQLQKKSKVRKESKNFIIEGLKMYNEVPEDRIVKTYISEEFYAEISKDNNEDGINKLFFNREYEIISKSVFKEISDTTTPQGILAIVKQPEFNFEEILKKENICLLFLENIRDPGNLGTIMRSSEGAGVDGIVLSNESVDIYNPKVIRSTMGAIYRMPFVYEDEFADALINKYKRIGIKLYAAYLDGAVDYAKIIYPPKTGIIIGNESNGISEKVVKLADELIKIPMKGQLESLNAAVSAALITYEIYRQKR